MSKAKTGWVWSEDWEGMTDWQWEVAMDARNQGTITSAECLNSPYLADFEDENGKLPHEREAQLELDAA